MMPHGRNPHFIGREALLSAMYESLTETKPRERNHRVALYGMAGVGKTQLAVEYIKRHEALYDSVFWMHAKDREALLGHFHLMAKHVGCISSTAGLKSEEVARLVLSWLQRQTKWILIFDNLDNIAVAEGFLPDTEWGGHTIITTRNANVDGIPAKGLEVPVCEVSEAMELLLMRSQLRTVGENEIIEATAIVEELGYLALAIEQAAAYIREEAKDIRKFLPRYRSDRKRFQKRTPTGNWVYKESVATTLALSFETLRKKDSLVARLLQLFSFLNPDGILIDFLVAGKQGLDDELRGVIEDPFALEGAIFLLEQFSLIRRLEDGDSIGIHRLLQYVIRDEMEPQQFDGYMQASLELSKTAFPLAERWNELDPQILQTCRSFQEQVVAPLTLDGWTKDLLWGEVARLLAKFLTDDGKFGLAIDLFTAVYEIRTQLLGDKQLETLVSMNDLAFAYREQGHRPQLNEAVRLQETALTNMKDILGEEHEDILLTTAELGLTYWYIDEVGKSVQLCKQAADSAERVLGMEHPTTLRILHYLAIGYWGQGRIQEASELQERVYSSRNYLLGDKHHDTLDARHNLGLIYRIQGRFEEAARLDEINLELRGALYGQEHPFTVHTMIHLSKTYWLQNRRAEATELRRTAFDIARRVSGELNHNTILVQCDLAAAHESEGRLADAAALFESALEHRVQTLGDEHLDTIYTQVRVAMVYRRQSRSREAMSLTEKASLAARRHAGDAIFENPLSTSQPAVVDGSNDRELTESAKALGHSATPLQILDTLVRLYKSRGQTWEVDDLEYVISQCIGDPGISNLRDSPK
jgi:tetratricopeptide (TPR) repeat protein